MQRLRLGGGGVQLSATTITTTESGMKTKVILTVNPKGGCGKSTLATNLASYYALWKVPVALVDYDPQLSSLEWLAQRASTLEKIEGIDASGGAAARVSAPAGVRRMILDAPARTDKRQLARLFEFADCALVPVLPSPMDIRATGHFIGELMLANLLKKTRVGLIANRVRENTTMYRNMAGFLAAMKVPLIAHLRDTQNYIRAAAGGYGIFEMAPYQADKDMEQWRPLLKWIEQR